MQQQLVEVKIEGREKIRHLKREIHKYRTKNIPIIQQLKADEKLNILLYAEDLVLISESKEGLQRQIDTLKNYCDQWKLKINVKKTKSMIFNRGNKIINTIFNVGGSPLENVKDRVSEL